MEYARGCVVRVFESDQCFQIRLKVQLTQAAKGEGGEENKTTDCNYPANVLFHNDAKTISTTN